MANNDKFKYYVTAVQKQIFSSIYIDHLYIYIGKHKEKITGAGIYNQVKYILDKKKLGIKFHSWLANEFNLDPQEEVPAAIIKAWEDRIQLSEKQTIFTRALRVIRLNNGYEFYGTISDSGQMEYLCNTDPKSGYPKNVINFICYNEFANQIIMQENLDHPLDLTTSENFKEIKTCLRHKLIPIIKEVKILANDLLSPCLGYYNLKTGKIDNPTPAWDNFIRTLPNDGSRECFMAWVYSVFKGDNHGRQMMWLHGKGDSGKSVVVQAIYKKIASINPGLVTSLEPLFYMDKFSAASYVKKRLTIAQDSTDRSMVKNQLVKNLTGNDNVSVVKKGVDKESANIYTKLLVTSNFAPWITPSKAEEISRMMYIHIDPEFSMLARAEWDSKKFGEWAICIENEIDDFIVKCKQHYDDRLLPDGHNLEIYPAMISKLSTNTFVSENLKSWWANCLEQFEPTETKKTNVIYYEALVQDYKRFLGTRASGGKYDLSIKFAMTPFLLEAGLEISRLTDTNNNLYIMGYDFKEELPSDRITLDNLLKKRAAEISKDGKMVGEIYASRKDPNAKYEEIRR